LSSAGWYFCQFQQVAESAILPLFGWNIGEGVGNMRIVVDLNRCLGYAQCVPLAPDVLQLNGEEALMYDPNPNDAQRLRVLRAAASCPVQAIVVDQLDESEVKKP
jgi:ferredoxin